MSGLSHTPGKRTKGKTFRGFESRPLRQHISPEFLRIQGFFVFQAKRRSLFGLVIDMRIAQGRKRPI
jgi:hypothetical protein